MNKVSQLLLVRDPDTSSATTTPSTDLPSHGPPQASRYSARPTERPGRMRSANASSAACVESAWTTSWSSVRTICAARSKNTPAISTTLGPTRESGKPFPAPLSRCPTAVQSSRFRYLAVCTTTIAGGRLDHPEHPTSYGILRAHEYAVCFAFPVRQRPVASAARPRHAAA